MLRQWLKKHGK
jgi:centrin-2